MVVCVSRSTPASMVFAGLWTGRSTGKFKRVWVISCQLEVIGLSEMAQFYEDLKVLEGALYQAPALAAFLEVLMVQRRKTPYILFWLHYRRSRIRISGWDWTIFSVGWCSPNTWRKSFCCIVLPTKVKSPVHSVQQKAFQSFVKSPNSELFFTGLEQQGEFVLNLLSEDK